MTEGACCGSEGEELPDAAAGVIFPSVSPGICHPGIRCPGHPAAPPAPVPGGGAVPRAPKWGNCPVPGNRELRPILLHSDPLPRHSQPRARSSERVTASVSATCTVSVSVSSPCLVVAVLDMLPAPDQFQYPASGPASVVTPHLSSLLGRPSHKPPVRPWGTWRLGFVRRLKWGKARLPIKSLRICHGGLIIRISRHCGDPG